MPDDYKGFTIPELTDEANIVTAFELFTDDLTTMVDDNGDTRFSGLIEVDVLDSPASLPFTENYLADEHLNALIVFENIGTETYTIFDQVLEGWNVAITHLSSGNFLPPPTGVDTNWTEPLPAFVIASLVKITKSDGTPFYVSTFGGTGVTP